LAIVGVSLLALGAAGAVDAQQQGPQPYTASANPVLITTPQTAYRQPLSDTDAANLRAALTGRTAESIRNARDSIQDPLARKIAVWALADGAAESMSFFEIDAARRDLAGWPRAARRQAAAEKKLETSGLDAARTIAWFGGDRPTTAEGTMAFASALRVQGRSQEAADLIRTAWRDTSFEVEPQRLMLARFPDVLTVDDHIRRADILLYGAQGPAAREMVALLPAGDQLAAQARMAMRAGSANAAALYASLTPEQQTSPGVAFERMAWLRKRDDAASALSQVRYLAPPPTDEAAARMWSERRALVGASLAANDWIGAYTAAANAGLPAGADAAEAEFFAGWLALSKLNNPKAAEGHFATLASVGSSPITRGRALYWQGRAAEALGDPLGAASFYGDGARHITTFYGQLAAEKAGVKTISLGRDPEVTAADRARFEGRELIRVARLLAESGLKDQFRAFVLYIDDTLPTAEEEALLVDLARSYGDQDLAMRAVRTAAQRGFILPERGYPILPYPDAPGGAEHAYTLSISRQESNFDPNARSGVGARGMMQLMPATARLVARGLGDPYSPERLSEPGYNMRLGSTYLGQMVGQFGGSYVLASAAYNAGPGRPSQWVGRCGDPRGAGTDALDFIECIPFSETRNYVMRTIETMMVYRARLNGGSAPLVLSSELKRGAYGAYATIGPDTSAQ
jgi:soluble lytic murein transglycosylase